MLRRSIQLNPAFADSHFELGKLLAERGDNSEAIGQLRETLRLNPSLSAAHYRLALLYRKLGRNQASDEELRVYRLTHASDSEDAIQRLRFEIDAR